MTRLSAMKIEPWLLPQIGIGSNVYPSSSIIVQIHETCLLQSESAMYSASVDKYAMLDCW